MITFFNVFHTAPARPPLGTPISDWRDVKSSKPPVFILLRTLPHHGQHPTPFLSITSTLFLSRRGMPPLFPFWNSPPTQHSAFFSTTYAVSILQVLLFDIHPSNGGCTPLVALPLTARPAQCPQSRLPRPQTAQSGPGKAPRDRCSSSGQGFLPPPPAA